MAALTLSRLNALHPAVSVPHYDPRSLTAGIVHFGVGGFHRSHEAMFIDQLLNTGQHRDWAICGVGVMATDTAIRDVLSAQDQLYTLVTKSPDGQQQARIIGSIVEYLYAPDAPEAVIEKLAHPATRIVSLTVTEGGYNVSNETGQFDATAADIQRDLLPGSVPRTVFGFITEGLRRRRMRGLNAFTVMSCDNMQHNGRVAQQAFTAFARLKDPEFGDWMTRNVAFPSSMVDRITPITTDEHRREVEATYGLKDEWPVFAETFAQWVLEDNFPLGRPPLEAVGVQMVTDVAPYELMKLRLLNASHQAMSYLGLLVGYTYVHEVCRHPVFVDFLLRYMAREAVPTLPSVPDTNLVAYQRGLVTRFASRAVQDTLARQVVDGSERIPKFLLPVLRAQLATGGEIRCAALVIASWSRYLEVTSRGTEVPALSDVRAALLMKAARREGDQPGSFLDVKEVFGDLGENERLRSAYLVARARILLLGPVGAIRALLDEGSPSLGSDR